MRTRLYAATLALLAVPLLAVADPNEDPNCGPDGWPALGIVQIGNDPAATFYVDDRNYVFGNGLWMYQESNGVFDPANEPIWNLQRGGSDWFEAEICTDVNPAGPDYWIF